MPSYKVEIERKELFVFDVLAKNENEAKTKTKDMFIEKNEDDMVHYYQVKNTEIEVSTVYDVTGTNDDFNLSK